MAAVHGCARYSSKELSPARVERALSNDDRALAVSAAELKHPTLGAMNIDLERGLSPEEAGVVAVVANPELRANRAERHVAAAQLFAAGLLPNPQLTGGMDFPYNSSSPDNFTAYNLGLEWEITALITHDQKVRAAAATAKSVALDVAWKEWQVANEARLAAYDLAALREQLNSAREAEQELSKSLDVIRKAVEKHQKTVVDQAAVQTSAQDARAAALAAQKDLTHQRLTLNRAMGFAPEREIRMRDVELSAHLTPPPLAELLKGLEDRRLDLVALRHGYESQDATLRAAILAQFPKISLGFNKARDTSNVHTFGFGVTIDIPLFDRNQGTIAIENATRDKLFDEYVNRVFVARSDLAMAAADIDSLNTQIAAASEAIVSLERVVKIYETAFNRGDLDAPSFYMTQSSLSQKRIDLIKLKQQLTQSWIAMEIAAGEYVPIEQADKR